MTTVASGRCTSAPARVDIAIGMKPMAATSAVVITGRSTGGRALDERIAASSATSPAGAAARSP